MGVALAFERRAPATETSDPGSTISAAVLGSTESIHRSANVR